MRSRRAGQGAGGLICRHSGTREARTRNPAPRAVPASGFRVRSRTRSCPGMTDGGLPNTRSRSQGARHRLYSLVAPGAPSSYCPLAKRGNGAPQGASVANRAARNRLRADRPVALHLRFFPAPGRAFCGGVAPPSACPCQLSRVEACGGPSGRPSASSSRPGRSARERSPGAARVRGDTWSLRAQAPHLAPSSKRLR